MSNAIKLLTLAAGLSCLATSAHAVVTQRLKQACRDEYFTYCSAHPVGSASLRTCMRASQYRFSERCLRELVAAGEASKRDVLRHRVRKSRKKH
jgi:adenylate kinase